MIKLGQPEIVDKLVIFFIMASTICCVFQLEWQANEVD